MKFIYFLVLLFGLNVYAQTDGFQVAEKKKITIPFQEINNLIFIELNINGVNLTFLLDSGVSETILFSLENKEVNFKNAEKVHFTGLGGADYIEGLKSTNNKVTIGKYFQDNNHQVYIILDERFNFSSHVGIPVNGIIGYEFFKNYPVKIDFNKNQIEIFNNEKVFKNKIKSYENLPITIEAQKPYVIADVEMTKGFFPAKMLIDLGNSDALWLFPNRIPNFNYNRPNIDDFLGRGFNGDIYGKRSRIHAIKLGKNILKEPIVSMPSTESVQSMNFVKDRIGSIGSDVLKRFLVVFDYQNNFFYFKKTSSLNYPFKFNMSGLDIKHDGMTWEQDLVKVEVPKMEDKQTSGHSTQVFSSQSEFQYKFVLKPEYSIAGVRENSPGFLADIKVGDKLIAINGKKTTELSLQQINEIFMSEEDKIIEITVIRNSQTFSKKIQLKDPIPYKDN